ncbi:MAG: restriction endonuclease subunit S [Akkermansia sp.]|nr:restriction endonuclease subunit S [Akkermansia sp.]
MKAYPAYKSSGVEWLEEIPENWEFRPIKRIFSEVDIKKGDAPYPLLSFSREKGLIIPPIDKKGVPDDLSCYKVLKKGQLLENRMQAWSGMFICADKDGCVSPDYSVFEAIDINTTSVKFYEYVFRNHIWVSLFANASKGIGTGFNRLYTPQFGAIKTIFPPYEEQNVIVAYLDKKCAEIEELISRRQSIIDRLRELKQSIIAEAVTKGLNPDVSMKDSGIAWLGVIPEHWEIRKLKYTFSERTEKNHPDEPILCATQSHGVIPQSLYKNRVVVVNKGFEGLKFVKCGDFVISLRSFEGGIEYAYYQGIISAAYTVLTPNIEEQAYFMKWLFKSKPFIQLLQTCVTGIREGQNINYQALSRKFIVLPPLKEQQFIVAYLDKKCTEIDELIARQEQIIEKLKELKTSTIAHVVTGKVDVRDAI